MQAVKIKGMSCQHCVGSVQKALEDLPGIQNVKVDLGKGEATYEGEIAAEKIEKAIAAIGFEAIAS